MEGLGSAIPARVCDQVGKKLPLNACQAELRQEGRLEIGVWPWEWDSLGSQGPIRGPPQPSPEAEAPCSLEPPRPATKLVNYSQGLSSLWGVGEGGRVPSVGNSILPREAVGNHGPWG